MSKSIDEKVVEMRFDNSHFEKNVQTSLNTLQKLKQSLDLKSASKGISDVGAAASRCNLSPLSSSVDAVQVKLSNLSVVGQTALMNLTNSAVNAGKRFVSALTIDPVTTGFNEYELKMGSIQTIMAGTGASLETVNKYLNELNEYSDKTIYSFSDMTQSIGKFTNAGVSLDKSVLAIKGVSNVAAVSGANANEASRAMYNFAQALSAGYVKLIDWKSIENANMATVEFKQQLIDTAVEVGTLTKVTDGYQTSAGNVISPTKNFNDSLQDQWMTTDVLIKTLGEYADETTAIGAKASAAATEVKTFSMMWDSLKESAQSGWATSWEILVGDFNQAKTFWTWLNDTISSVVGKMNDNRNNYLRDALGDNNAWGELSGKIEKAGVSLTDFEKAAKKVASAHGHDVDAMIKKHGSFAASLKEGWLTSDIFSETMTKLSKNTRKTVEVFDDGKKKLEELKGVANRVIQGEFGNGQQRIDALTKAGYKYAQVQTIVNQLLSGQKVELEGLSSTQLKQIGYTDEQIAAIQELGAQAKESGSSIDELVQSMSKPSGRDLLFDSFKNIKEVITDIFDIAKKAWDEVFATDEKADSNMLYNIIEMFHSLTEAMQITQSTAANMGTAFKGLADGFWLVKNLGGGVFKTIHTVLNNARKLLGLTDIWAVLGAIGKGISTVKNAFAGSGNELGKMFMNIGNSVKQFITDTTEKVANWINEFRQLPIVQEFMERFADAFKNTAGAMGTWIAGFAGPFQTFFESISSLDEITFDGIISAFETLIKDLMDHIGTFGDVFSDITKVATDAYNAIISAGDNAGGGFAVLADTIANVVNWLKSFIGLFKTAYNSFKSLDSFTFESIGEIFSNLGKGIANKIGEIPDIFSSIGDSLSGFADLLREKFGEVGSFLGGVIDNIVNFGRDFRDAFNRFFVEDFGIGDVGVIAMSATIIVVLTKLASIVKKITGLAWDALASFKLFGTSFKGLCENIGEAAKTVAKSMAVKNFAISLGILAASLWLLSTIPAGSLIKAGVALIVLGGAFVAFMFAMNKMGDAGKLEVDITTTATALAALAGSLLLLVIAVKLLDTVDSNNLGRNLGVLAGMLAGLCGAIIAIGRFTPKMVASAGHILAVSVGLFILVAAIRSLAELKIESVGGTILLLGAAIAALVIVLNQAKDVDLSAAVGIILIAGSIWVMVKALKTFSNMSFDEIAENILKMLPIFTMIFILLKTSAKAGLAAKRSGVMIKTLSQSLIFIVIAMKILAGMSAGELAKGIVAVGLLMAIMTGILMLFKHITSTGPADVHKAGLVLLEIAAAILLLTIPIAILSMIKFGSLMKAVVAIGVVMVLLTGMLDACANIKEGDKVKGVVMSMAITIGVLAAALAILSFISFDRLMTSVLAMVSVMGMFTVMLNAVGALGAPSAKAIAVIVILTLVIGGLAAVLYMLADLKPENALSAAISISSLLLAMSVCMKILSTIKGAGAMSAMPAMAAILLVVTGIALILGVMSALNVSPSIESAVAISILLLTMTAVLAALSALGAFASAAITGAFALIGVVAIIGTFVGLVGAVFNSFPEIEGAVDKGIEVLNKIAEGIGSFISSIGKGLTSGLPDMAEDLSAFTEALGPFVDGMRSIDGSVVDGVISLVDALREIKKLGTGDTMNKFFGGGSSLQMFGEDLPKLAEALASFSGRVSGINPDGLGKIANAMDTIATAAGKIPDGGLFGTDISEFGTDLEMFGTSLSNFNNTVSGIEDASKVDTIADVTDKLVTAASKVPDDGLFKADMSSFGSDLETFGTSLCNFNDAVDTIEDTSKIDQAADATETLVRLGKSIPEGGIFKYDLGDFATDVRGFGNGLTAFATATSEIDTSNFESIAEATTHIVNMSKKIPEGGLFKNDLGNFAQHIGWFGGGLKTFSDSIAGLDTSNFEPVVNATSHIVEMSAQIPEGGLFKNDLGSFATDVSCFGGGLKRFHDSVSGITDITCFKNAVEAGKALTELQTMLPEGDGWFDGMMSMGDLGAAGAKLGKGIAEMGSNLGSVDTTIIDNAISAAKQLADMITGVSGIEAGAVDGFNAAISALGDTGLDGFVAAFQNGSERVSTAAAGLGRSAVTGFKNAISQANVGSAATSMISSFSSAISNGAVSISNACSTVVSSGVQTLNNKSDLFSGAGGKLVKALASGFKASTFSSTCGSVASSGASAASGYYSSFYSTGQWLGQGLVDGLDDMLDDVIAKGEELGREAAKAANKGAVVNSPSKLTIETGKSLCEGMIVGMDMMCDSVYKTSYDMGADACASLARAIKPVTDLGTLGVDDQPVIRPVLDLTDVQNGATRIGSMLNNPSMSLGSSIYSAIGGLAGIGSRYGENDVVDAINKLRGDISKIKTTENNVSFNDVSFNDDDRINTLMIDLMNELVRKGVMG